MKHPVLILGLLAALVLFLVGTFFFGNKALAAESDLVTAPTPRDAPATPADSYVVPAERDNTELQRVRLDLGLPTVGVRGFGKSAQFGLGMEGNIRFMFGQNWGLAFIGGAQILWPAKELNGQQWAYTVGVGPTIRTRRDGFVVTVGAAYTSRYNNSGQAMDMGGGIFARTQFRVWAKADDSVKLSVALGGLVGPAWVYKKAHTTVDEDGNVLSHQSQQWPVTTAWGLDAAFVITH